MLKDLLPTLNRSRLAPVTMGHSGFGATALQGPVSQYIRPNDFQIMTEGATLGLPAAWRCVQLISNAVAQTLRHGHVYNIATNDLIEPKPLVADRPNLLYTKTNFWAEVVTTTIIHGNYIALITAVDADGYPLQLTPIHPSNVTVSLDTGFPIYEIGENKYNHRQVVHVRGLTLPGSWWGVGVVEAHVRALGTAYSQQTYARSSYEAGGPSLVVGLDTVQIPGQEELDRIKNQWSQKFAGGHREVAVLPKTIEVKPVSWSPEEMEFLASRQFSIAEIALMFNLDPTDLSASFGGLSALTYANIEQREMSRIIDSYGAWMHRVEDIWTDLLPEGQRFVANPDSRLRSDTRTRYETHKAGIEAGFLTVDEARALEGRKPLTEQQRQETQGLNSTNIQETPDAD